jgi:two-component system, OmpR family, KDP operon response regulator KdpE
MKILLVEDSLEILKGVSLTFNLRWPDAIVLTAMNGNDGIKIVEEESPDIVILDLNLPDMSGFEVLETIRRFSNIPVIILSVRDSEVDELRGLEMGADDYIVKPFSPANLLTRVQAVLRRSSGSTIHEHLIGPISVKNVTVNIDTGEVFLDKQRVQITPNESKILYCLVKNQGKLVTKDVLKRTLWGSKSNFYDNNILKRYVYQLRKKLGDDAFQPHLIISERGLGYRLINS